MRDEGLEDERGYQGEKGADVEDSGGMYSTRGYAQCYGDIIMYKKTVVSIDRL